MGLAAAPLRTSSSGMCKPCPQHPAGTSCVSVTVPQDYLLPVWGLETACALEDGQGHLSPSEHREQTCQLFSWVIGYDVSVGLLSTDRGCLCSNVYTYVHTHSHPLGETLTHSVTCGDPLDSPGPVVAQPTFLGRMRSKRRKRWLGRFVGGTLKN